MQVELSTKWDWHCFVVIINAGITYNINIKVPTDIELMSQHTLGYLFWNKQTQIKQTNRQT